MSRVKLSEPIQATPEEEYFIRLISRTDDRFGYRESWIVSHINLKFRIRITGRTLRTWKERYNSYKYINMTPKFRIYTLNGLYRRVDSHSKYRDQIAKKQKLDLLCALKDYHNYLKVFDEVNTQNQMNLYELATILENEEM
jgi:hypothetical protein